MDLLSCYLGLVMPPLPRVGSREFESLSYKAKLEIIALQLFRPDEYEELTGGKKRDSISPASREKLALPKQSEFAVADLPVSFLRRYWCGYQCNYKEEWYPDYPLDDYGLEIVKAVNIWAANFTLISISSPLYYVASWVAKCYCRGELIPPALLIACKILIFLDMESSYDLSMINQYFGDHPSDRKATKNALEAYSQYKSFHTVNGFFPIIEETRDLYYFENKEFQIYNFARPKHGRWFYPLVPSVLYRVPQFKIMNWAFLE